MRGEVLVAILNNKLDFNLARTQHWYRIPVNSVEKWLKNRWPPKWIAFYQTKVFDTEAHAINYYAQIIDIRQVSRWELFPDEPNTQKRYKRYYQIFFHPLQKLPRPILSRRFRRIVFIPTTEDKFFRASEINDLYDESPLEDRLWAEFKRLGINAERQEFIQIRQENYALDFAIYCATGKIDVETDGDTWHVNPEKATQDNIRDNSLVASGWKVLRFNTIQIKESTIEYCVPKVVETINNLGGVDEGGILPKKIDTNKSTGNYQLSLFDDL